MSQGRIGIKFGKDQVITEVVNGGPGSNAGLRVGDKIISVDGSTPDVSKIRGIPGTTLILKVNRGGEVLQFTLIRERLNP